jgi:hypothetical protein
MNGRKGGFRARLCLFECEGHGYYWEVYDGGEYAGTFDKPEDVCKVYAGRIAEVYTHAAYEAACAERIAADPDDWDCSDVVPEPVLAIIQRPPGDADDAAYASDITMRG